MRKSISVFLALGIILSMLATPVSAVSDDPPPTPPALRFKLDNPENQGATTRYNQEDLHATIDGSYDSETGSYIVKLAGEPLPSYRGGLPGLRATNPESLGESKLNLQSAASQRYLNYLEKQQNTFIHNASKALGHELDISARYKIAYNGFAVALTPTEAAQLAAMEGVLAVTPDKILQLQTDASVDWIGTAGIWDGSHTGGVTGTMGEGLIIGIIDSGINMDHPSFADVGNDGYDHTNPRGTYYGWCNSSDPDYDANLVCNDKLIGVYSYPDTNDDPEDDDGHGSHTASTAAGNFVTATIGELELPISGVAPHANIISYDVCIKNEGCQRSSILAAIEDAIIDSVDVINYSVGGSASNPWMMTDESYSFLQARNAGIFVATAAGNAGPDPSTTGSPNESPWLVAVGNISSDRGFETSLIDMTGDGTPPADILGRSVSPSAYGPAKIVLASAYGDALCLNPFAFGTFNGEIVVCDRGEIAMYDKVVNAKAGGAGGVVIANIDGGNNELLSLAYELPAVHINASDANAVRAWIGSGSVHTATISASNIISDVNFGDIVAMSSSRGPSQSLADVLKPDIAAPGSNILAAYMNGYEYRVVGGTSMASPHIAGAGALLKAIHPDWSPEEIQSALMLTAKTDIRKNDDQTVLVPATPLDTGSGRVDLTRAALAGFVLDEAAGGYEAANPVVGGDPTTLNLASFANEECIFNCSWTRVLTSTMDHSVTWTVSIISETAALGLTVEPESFTLNPGSEQVITVTADVTDVPVEWTFAHIMLTPDVTDTVEAHFPLAVLPSKGILPELVDIHTRRNAGSQLLEDLTAMEIHTMTLESFGLTAPVNTEFSLSQIPSKTLSFPAVYFQAGSYTQTINVPAGTLRMVTTIMESESPDLDLLVVFDHNGNGVPDVTDFKPDHCESSESGSQEMCSIEYPREGTWFVIIINYTESASAPDDSTLGVALITSDASNMSASGPQTVAQLTPFDLRVAWDLPTLEVGDVLFGAITLGSEPGLEGNIGIVPVNITREEDDVTKSVAPHIANPGDVVTYTITVKENSAPEDFTYMLTDTIPSGLTYVPGSASASSGSVNVVGNQLTWQGTQIGRKRTYLMSTSDENSLCDTGYGGYLDLESLDLYPRDVISGNGFVYNVDEFYGTGPAINFYGHDRDNSLRFTDDGFGFFDSSPGATPGNNTAIPDANDPNDMLAIFWRDMEIVYDAATNRGISIAGAGNEVIIVEYDDAEPAPAGSSSARYDFELVLNRQVNDAAYNYEIVFAYDNISGTLTPATVGIENYNASQGLSYVYNNATSNEIHDGLMVCFDWNFPEQEEILITYAASVDADASSGNITNEVLHSVDNPSSKESASSTNLEISLVIRNWNQEVWLKGSQYTPQDGPFQVFAGDEVTLVDHVSVTSTENVTFSLDNGWNPMLDLQSYSVDAGSVVSAASSLTWTLSNGNAGTTYAMTKTFTVNQIRLSGSHQGILSVENSTLPSNVSTAFEIIAVLNNLAPTSVKVGDVFSYTLQVNSAKPILIDGSMMLTDIIPAGVTFSGSLTTTHGSAWYNATDDSVYWNNAMGLATMNAPNAPTAIKTLLNEGFEEGTMPPTGWTHESLSNPPANTWYISDQSSHSGTYEARIEYDDDNASNEWLTSPEIAIDETMKSPQLSFWVDSDTEYPAATMTLYAIDTSDNSSITLWDLIADENWPTARYREVIVDLSTCIGKNIKLAWRYHGLAGESFYMDDILVTAEGIPAKVSVTFDVTTNADALSLPDSTIHNVVQLNTSQGIISTTIDTFVAVKSLYLPLTIKSYTP